MDYSTLDNPKFCDFEGCGRKHYAHGLCATHDNQRRRGLELSPIRAYRTTGPREKTPCAFEGCVNPSRTKGWCTGHWSQVVRLGSAKTPLRARRANGAVVSCAFDGCSNNTNRGAHGLCAGHNRQRRLGQDLHPLPDLNNASARDGKGRKRCGKCREWLTLGSFHNDTTRVDKLNSNCKPCLRAKMLFDKYNVTTEQYDLMLSAQGYGCAICGVAESPDGSALAVDHDHACCDGDRSCGACVRALLCRNCNQGLGNFRDNPEYLRTACEYLRKHGK